MPCMSVEWKLRLLVKILATTGICYQVYCQTHNYLLYPSYSSISIDLVHTRIPAISMCVSFWSTREETFYHSLPVYNASLLMPSYDEAINSCHLTLPNGSAVDCVSVSQPAKYMNNKMVCFSFFEKNATSLPDEQLMYSRKVRLQNGATTPLMRINFNSPWNNSDHFTVSVRSHERPIRLMRSTESKVWLEPKVNKQVVLSYRITRRIELPPPHGSCRSYPHPFDSEQSMINCWFNKFTTFNGTRRRWPNWVFFDYQANYTQEEKSLLWPKTGSDNIFRTINDACVKANLRIDCDRHYIILDKLVTRKSDEPEKHLTCDILSLPDTQLTVVNCIKTTLYTYFYEVGCILTMWTAFSINFTAIKFVSCLGGCIRSTVRPRPPRLSRRSKFRSTRDKLCSKKPREQPTYSCIRKLNNIFMRMICWVVTLYFVVDIISIYFEKPFDTAIYAHTPTTLSMLGVSVCFNMVIHPFKVKQFYPDLYESVAPDQWKSTFSVEQIFKTTTEWHEVYHPSSTYLSPDNGYVKIHEHFNSTKSITGLYTCFTTLSPKEYLLSGPIKDRLRLSTSWATTMYLSLNTSQLHKLNQSRVRVYFHDDGLVREDHAAPHRFLIVGNKDARLYPNRFVVRTYRTISKLYPDHMMSTCLEYEKKFGYNREFLFDRCISKNFISRYRVWPSGYQLWQSTQRDKYFKMKGLEIADLNFSNNSLREKFNSIQDDCDKLLHKAECEELYVKVRVEDEFFRHTGLTSIVLYPPSKQFFLYEQQLIYSIVDIIGYIGGTINAWIGLSFLDFQIVILAFYRCYRFLFTE